MSSSPTAFPLYADLVLGLTLQPAHSNLCNFIQYGKSMFTSKDLGGTRSLDPNRRGSTFAFVFQSQAGVREAGQWKDGDAATLCHGEICVTLFFTRHHTVLHIVSIFKMADSSSLICIPRWSKICVTYIKARGIAEKTKTTPVLVFVLVQFPNSRMQMKRISQVRLCYHCVVWNVFTSFDLSVSVYQTHNFIRLNEKGLPV